MRFWLKAIVGLVVAFVLNGVVTVGFQQAVGQEMLQVAGWTTGTRPPTAYMVASVTAALIAAAVAGIAAALIVGRARIRHALVAGGLFSGLAVWANRATLFANPHPYEWPLILAPLVALPLGAWLVVYLRPLPKDPSAPMVAA